MTELERRVEMAIVKAWHGSLDLDVLPMAKTAARAALEECVPDLLRLLQLEHALRTWFPHFQEGRPVNAEAIGDIGQEYQDMQVRGGEVRAPSPCEICGKHSLDPCDQHSGTPPFGMGCKQNLKPEYYEHPSLDDPAMQASGNRPDRYQEGFDDGYKKGYEEAASTGD